MDVGNSEAAPTPPPQLPTQLPSSGSFFFLFEICEVGGRRGFSQIWLHVREESLKVLRMVLHFGEMLERIVNMWRFKKQILIIWGGFDNLYGFFFFFFPVNAKISQKHSNSELPMLTLWFHVPCSRTYPGG
jgi:hypothetical protein